MSHVSGLPNVHSFIDIALSPGDASSQTQEQLVAGNMVVDANILWTPMLAGCFTLSLRLYAGC
jgi:hypothetical protein